MSTTCSRAALASCKKERLLVMGNGHMQSFTKMLQLKLHMAVDGQKAVR